ncbi:MAG: protein phosphatase 2C family protein [Alphaproteobacteria bacterium]|nr:protein phosphatase 2C family protein [Alphaproteobacteria bacterium]
MTRDSIDLARQEFISTNRPKLRVRYVSAATPSYNWKPTAKIYISNVGASPAVLLRNGVDIFLREKGTAGKAHFDAQPRDITPSITLVAGKDAGMDAIGHTGALTSKNVADIINGVFELCLLGIVSYTDGNAVERSTSYFRIWDVQRKRFVRAPPDDEYAEWEFED